MIWDKPITADGHTATPEQLQAAWDRWIRNLPEDAALLTGILCREGAGTNARPWRCARVADRMLQKARRRLFVAGIIGVVAEAYGLRRGDLTGPSRQQVHVIPRWIAMALARSMTDASLPVIGRLFGGRDHTSVMHALHQLDQRRATDQALDRRYREIEALCQEAARAA